MSPYKIALFGEAQKGDFRHGYYCQSVAELMECVGEPPSQESQGIPFAIQALLYNRGVIFFRVHEEGFSIPDYLRGLNLLENREEVTELSAICMPGVGSSEILDATQPLCETYKSFLIINEFDLYDYLTCR